MTEHSHSGSHSPSDAHSDGGEHHHVHFDAPEMVAHLELENEVLAPLNVAAIEIVAERCEQRRLDVRRVIDVGAGPGVVACALAERFPAATVAAVDGSATMLEHARARAERVGLADRVTTVRAELPADFGILGTADVVWASLAIHHIGNEIDALRRLRDLLNTGGLLGIVEFGDPMRVLVDDADLGRPGLWDRLDAAWAEWFEAMRAELPGATTSDPYPQMIDAAGFEVVSDELLSLTLDAPLGTAARRFSQRHLAGARTRLGASVAPDDLAALDPLVGDDESSVLHRRDVGLRASRRLYVASAPST